MKEIQLSGFIEKAFETTEKTCEWFGYYNYDTLNHDQSQMLCNHASFDGIKVEKGMTIEVGIYDIAAGKWEKAGESDSFNWQQGAMLQWLPGEGNENKIIYNLSDNGRLISRIYDIKQKQSRDINWPIYGLTPDGKKSIAVDLERSYWCRAYHYESVANEEKNTPIPSEDGIFEIDLEKNSRKRIIDISDVIQLDPDEDFTQLKHWFEHVMISPNGKRFCFLHRFSPIENAMIYQTRLVIADIDGKNLQVVPGWRDYSFSHFGWKDDDSFIIYGVKIPAMQKSLSSAIRTTSGGMPSKISVAEVKKQTLSILKSILPRKLKTMLKGNDNGYHFYKCNEEGRFYLVEKWNQKLFCIDGHPSFTRDGRYVITDTYPDSQQMQHLIVYDTVTKKGLVVAKLYASLMKTPASCDLHPKLCRDNNYVVVDTAYDKQHHMIIFKLNWDKIKKNISNYEDSAD